MPYTKEEGGRLNNFAAEPEVYIAEPPTNAEKRNYAIWGALALVFVSSIIFLAVSISGSAGA
jgi:hypothetical protein